MSGGILSDEERALLRSLYESDETASAEHDAVLGQLRSVLEQVEDAGLRTESIQVIEDVLGRAVARRQSTQGE